MGFSRLGGNLYTDAQRTTLRRLTRGGWVVMASTNCCDGSYRIRLSYPTLVVDRKAVLRADGSLAQFYDDQPEEA